MPANHIVAVTFKPKSEQHTAFQEVLQSVKNELPMVEGCLAVRVMQHQKDPTVFLVLEDWQSAEMHDAHINRLVQSGDWAALESMLSVPPSSSILSQI